MSLMLGNFANMYTKLTAFFKKEQILWLDGDDFVRNPVSTLNQVEDFLKLPTFFTKDHFDFSGKKGFPCFKLDEASLKYCMGNHKARDHPKLSEESLQILRNHFTPILEKFKKQTGIELELS